MGPFPFKGFTVAPQTISVRHSGQVQQVITSADVSPAKSGIVDGHEQFIQGKEVHHFEGESSDHRCESLRLGSNVEQLTHSGALDADGVAISDQSVGVESSTTSAVSLFCSVEGPASTRQDGQHHNQGPPEQTGRFPFSVPAQGSGVVVQVGSRSSHDDQS